MNDRDIRMYANLTNAFTLDKMKEFKKHLKYSGNAPLKVTVNRTDDEKISFTMRAYVSSPSGYQGCLLENQGTGDLVVVHEGSMDLAKIFTDGSEVYKDWGETDAKHFFGKISEQFYDSNNFLNKVKQKFPTSKIIQAAQSLGGTLSQMNGALAGNEKIETYTYNTLGAGKLMPKMENDGYVLSKNKKFPNINTFTYNNEKVAKLCSHIGNVHIANYTETKGNKIHRLEAHQEQNLKYKLCPELSNTTYKSKSGSSTGGAAPVKTEVTKTSSGANKTDEDGHWITTPEGNHVFIEDECILSMRSKIPFNAKGMAYRTDISIGTTGVPSGYYGWSEVYFSNHSPEYWAVQNDPEIIAYKSRNKGNNVNK